jgi:hypothetical protein
MGYPLPWGRGLGCGVNDLIITPTLILPPQGGGRFFRELDAPQLAAEHLILFVSKYCPPLRKIQ